MQKPLELATYNAPGIGRVVLGTHYSELQGEVIVMMTDVDNDGVVETTQEYSSAQWYATSFGPSSGDWEDFVFYRSASKKFAWE